MKVLGLDFETTSLDTKTTRVIEIGAVLWETERKAPLELLSCLVLHSPNENVVIGKETLEITGIRIEDVKEHGITPLDAFSALHKMMARSEYVVAHNGTFFDKPIYEAEVKRLGMEDVARNCFRPWIDTRLDVAYPRYMVTRNAGYLETEHKLVNPFPHRAVFDTLTMLQLLSNYKIEDVIKLSKSPTLLVKANVSYDDREKAKNRGYRWDKPTNSWVKYVKESELDMEKSEVNFEVAIVSKL